MFIRKTGANTGTFHTLDAANTKNVHTLECPIIIVQCIRLATLLKILLHVFQMKCNVRTC